MYKTSVIALCAALVGLLLVLPAWAVVVNGVTRSLAFVSQGPAVSVAGCSAAVVAGSGSSAGLLTAGTSGSCSVVVTLPFTAPNGWACAANNLTTANLFRQSATTTTTATLDGVTVNGDTLSFACLAF